VLPNQFIALEYFTPLKDKAEATATFDAMVDSFEIFDKEQVAKRRVLAIEAGKKWLAQRTAEELKAKLLPDQLFRVKVAGKDIGYMLFKELEVRQAESLGIRLGIISKTFFSEGRDVEALNLAFWAYSHDDKGAPRPAYSEWENKSKTLATGKQYPGGQYVFWVKEAGTLNEEGGSPIPESVRKELEQERQALIRKKVLTPSQMPPPITESLKQSHLIVTYMGDPTQDFHEANKGINVVIPDFRPAVLPKILEYTWPRLTDLTKPSEMTFAVFNSTSRKMTLRTFSVIGSERIRVQGKLTDSVKCTDEMDNTGTTLWVDNTGRILKMLTSDQTLMEPTTIGTMQELWGNKLGLFDQK
jgi:hypothetical protein